MAFPPHQSIRGYGYEKDQSPTILRYNPSIYLGGIKGNKRNFSKMNFWSDNVARDIPTTKKDSRSNEMYNVIENISAPQNIVLQKSLSIYGTRMFMAAFERASNWPLSHPT
jgi:hypothetical protein